MKKLLDEVQTLQRIAFGRGAMKVSINIFDGITEIHVYLPDSLERTGSGRSYLIAGWRELSSNRTTLARIRETMADYKLLMP